MKQLDPKAVWLLLLIYLGRWAVLFGPLVFIAIGVLFLPGDTQKSTGGSSVAYPPAYFFSLLLAFSVLFLIFLYVWARLAYRFYRYELREDGFRKEYGVIYKRYVTIPYDRIQNVDILRGIWARILGLSDLQIQTAGVSGVAGSEGRLPGLSFEEAERLRDELIRRARASKGQGL
ncbi:MAG: PH domain-containing protein [bacterium]|nr:PH domain-containing protein [bacterium]